MCFNMRLAATVICFSILLFSTAKTEDQIFNRLSGEELKELSETCGKTPAIDGSDDSESKIFNGQTVKEGELPWAVKIRASTAPFIECTGSLISTRHILTAAHCFYNVGAVCKSSSTSSPEVGIYKKMEMQYNSPAVADFYFGSICPVGRNRSLEYCKDAKTPIKVKAKKIIIKKVFAKEACAIGHDFVIVELEKDVEITPYVQPICLLEQDKKARKYLDVFGWGRAPDRNFFSSSTPFLQKTTMQLIDTEKCVQTYHEHFGWINLQDVICTNETGTNGCMGDSGGGLIQKEDDRNFLVGLVSMGTDCEKMFKLAQQTGKNTTYLGAVFTDLRKHSQFICYYTGICPGSLKPGDINGKDLDAVEVRI